MRVLAAVAVLCGCHAYDPVDELEHREYADTRTAIAAILAETPTPRVYAVGEYHPGPGESRTVSPLRRFTSDIIGQLAPHARHLVVEAWLDDGCRSAAAVETQIAAVVQRPPRTATDIQHLLAAGRERQLAPHGLEMTCIEHGAMLDAHGRIDFFRLLELVTDKLHEAARAYAADNGVIVYGGALHNDLYPRWPLAQLSYAAPLAEELGGHVLELDLVVPEIVAPMPIVRLEPWFPLLARASPGRVIVWERGPASYVVILPAESERSSEAVAKVAMPVAAM